MTKIKTVYRSDYIDKEVFILRLCKKFLTYSLIYRIKMLISGAF